MIQIDESKATELYILFLETFRDDINIIGPTILTGITIDGSQLENQTVTISKEVSQNLFRDFVDGYIRQIKKSKGVKDEQAS